MKRSIKGRIILLIGVTLISVIFSLPSTPAYKYLPEWAKRFLPDKEITLGLDLQGGIHLVLDVEEEKAIENLLDRYTTDIKDFLKENNIPFERVEKNDNSEIVIWYSEEDAKEKILKVVADGYPNLNNTDREDKKLTFALRGGEIIRIKESATTQALETIRNRIDQFGIREPLIQRQDKDKILIQLPGIKDPKRAIELIGKTALLEFKLLDEDNPLLTEMPSFVFAGEEDELLKKFEEKLPEGDEILFENIRGEDMERVQKRPYLVKKNTVITGDLLTDARVSIGDFNESYVSITFNPTGARLFERITRENVKKRLAIILDNNIYSAPVIQDAISGGRAQITGRFTTEEANDLAIVLRAGSLPAPVTIIQNLTVGASLGKDSITKGLRATLIAGLLVTHFMIIYYRLSGIIANVALLLNLIVLVGSFAFLNATLTLPGIAGIALTIGMGVDSNVLIFERIREELRSGKPVRLSVDSGYNKAFLTIVDSHVTTLITSFALFMFGTGPIKGFAVGLSLGITINLFTALVGTKVIFDIINRRKRLEKLSI
ncbi:MAG: protein translocase subunit SecD [Nitrospirota bacterium]